MAAQPKWYRKPILRKFRRDFIEKHDYTCFYCGKRAIEGEPPKKKEDKILAMMWLHIDHYIPLAKGGKDDESNFVLACNVCNSKKRAMLPEDFINKLRQENGKLQERTRENLV